MLFSAEASDSSNKFLLLAQSLPLGRRGNIEKAQGELERQNYWLF
jgi:hypothetical protein